MTNFDPGSDACFCIVQVFDTSRIKIRHIWSLNL